MSRLRPSVVVMAISSGKTNRAEHETAVQGSRTYARETSGMVRDMRRQRRPHALAGSPGSLLLMALTMLGLFAMHGLQATASPVDLRPSAITVAMPGMSDVSAEAGHHAVAPPSHHSPRHQHPGGHVCLALLVMAALLILSAVSAGHAGRLFAAGGLAGKGREHQGRAPPPPSIFQLSVLRL